MVTMMKRNLSKKGGKTENISDKYFWQHQSGWSWQWGWWSRNWKGERGRKNVNCLQKAVFLSIHSCETSIDTVKFIIHVMFLWLFRRILLLFFGRCCAFALFRSFGANAIIWKQRKDLFWYCKESIFVQRDLLGNFRLSVFYWWVGTDIVCTSPSDQISLFRVGFSKT